MTKRTAIVFALIALMALVGITAMAQGVAPKGILITPPNASGLTAQIWVDKGAYAIGENIQIHFRVSQDAYVYIYDIDAAGKVSLLFPNYYSQNNRVSAGEHVLPDSSAYNLNVVQPTGTEYMQLIASAVPLNLTPQFQITIPFPLMGSDPDAFKLQLQGQLMGVVPDPQWAEDWTSFEVVSAGYAPSYGTLIINSVPISAWITIDGAFVGYTSRSMYVSQGYHQVAVGKSGYADSSRGIFVIANTTRTLKVTLAPLAPVNQPPTAAFNYTPTNPIVGGWVQFNASASNDSDGTISSYAWNFGDGTTSTGVTRYHQFASPGTYNVILTVTDNDGASDTEAHVIQVGSTNQPPTAAFNYTPTNPIVGGWVQFNASASNDSDGTISSYAWNFGDGTTSTSATRYHQFASPGAYNVILTVTDNDGASDTEAHVIQVGSTNQTPVAVFNYSPLSPGVGENILLNASASYDPDGTIVSYAWDLDNNGATDATNQSVYVTYYDIGPHLVRLTVTDNNGLSASTTQVINVAGGGIPGQPAMGNTAGIFVWGTMGTWHITVNAGAGWMSPHSYRLELRTDGSFQGVNQSTSGGVVPLGVIPTPTDSGKTLVFNGSLQAGSADYTFTVPSSKSVWMSLKLDINGDGMLDEAGSFVYLRTMMVHSPAAPFVVGLPSGSSGPLVPSMNFRIGRALTYSSTVRFIMWMTDINTLEGH
jgi:PKD repeat protein